MVQLVMVLVLLIISCSNAEAKCIVNQDCAFEYVPVKISDGYSRDNTLTLNNPDDLNLDYKFDDDTTWTNITTQADTCPPSASGACMTQMGSTGAYRLVIDGALIPTAEANKRLCLDVRDIQGTRTVPDTVICQDVDMGEQVFCDITAATNNTSFTMGNCVDSVGNALTLATDMFRGTIWKFYTKGATACNVIDQKFYINSMSGGGVVTAGASGKLVPVATPNTSNCGATNP